MDERVLVTDLEAGHPPMLHVRMVAITDVNGTPAAHAAFVAMVEVLQPVQVVQVPADRGVLAVDLEGVKGLVPARVTGGLEGRQRTVAKAGQEGAGVIDADFLDFAGEGVLALLDEGLGHGVDLVDAAVEPDGGVDAVRQQIAGDAAAGDFHVEPPKSGAALREVLRDRPVLQEFRAVMEDASEAAFVDELFGQGNGRDAAIVVPDHVRHLRALDGLDHFLAFGAVHRERLFAQDHFAGLGGGEGDWGVSVVWTGDVDEVDVVARDEFAPVGFDRIPTPLRGETFGLRGVPGTDRLEDRPVAQVEEVVDLAVGVRVRPAHEAVTNKSDVELFHFRLLIAVSRKWAGGLRKRGRSVSLGMRRARKQRLRLSLLPLAGRTPGFEFRAFLRRPFWSGLADGPLFGGGLLPGGFL